MRARDKLCIVRTQEGTRGMTGRCQHCGTRNGPAVQVCRHCGEPLGGESSVPFTDAAALDRPVPVAVFEPATGRRARPSTGLRLALLFMALVAGAWWWAARPSVAGVVSSVAVPGVAAAAAEPAARSEPAQASPVAVAGDETPAGPAALAEPASAPESTSPKAARSRDKTADLTRAKALREQLADEQAQADAARRSAEEEAARSVPVPPVVMADPVPAPTPKTRTAEELCASGNALGRGICLARSCIGPEHAEEAACQQLRAADDQRRH